MEYPKHVTVQYTNNSEYREEIRKLFEMKPHCSYENPDEIDEISLDEDNFDEQASVKMVEYIFDNTFLDPYFNDIYHYAAGLMLSDDINIGLVVLLSYDYLACFHVCLCRFFTVSKDEWLLRQDEPCLVELRTKLGIIN